MKRFFQGMIEWKRSASLLYTGAMVLYLFFCTIFGHMQISLTMLWTLLAVSLASALIQGICFSSWIIKKMRYTWRSFLFIALFFPLLSFTAWKAEWFPTEQLGSWVLFSAIFLLIFVVMTIGFHIYYRAAGKKYDGLVGRYRRQKEEEES
ncbi:MAG: hypothetical protein HFK04_06085 [Oscillospiraceae bacterium]|nr:hypothetical protein [Oscillospiraceae bacterium]